MTVEILTVMIYCQNKTLCDMQLEDNNQPQDGVMKLTYC